MTDVAHRRWFAVALAAVGLCAAGRGADADYEGLRNQVRALGRLTAPPATHPADGFAADGLRPLFYDGLPYRGRPTRVFAWYGAPPGRAGKVPAVVLVHGGGGT